MLKLQRHPANPIVRPSKLWWRSGVTFNPAVEMGPNGEYIMLERAAQLQPFQSVFGALRSTDAVHFELIQDTPVWTPAHVGTPRGDVEDPRVTRIGATYYMTYVHYHSHWNVYPTGGAFPANYTRLPCDKPKAVAYSARTGLAVSSDMLQWKHLCWIGPEGWDDKDNVLFPEKIGGKYVMLTRPTAQVGPQYGCTTPSIWLKTSEDLLHWSEARLHSTSLRESWEGEKIGGSAPPLKTDRGWLISYHGVQHYEYRMGFMLLDLQDPFKVVARTPEPMLSPEFFYEQTGFVIQNCVFPSASIVKDGQLHVYYGACDSCIALATIGMDELLSHLLGSCACR